MTSVTWQPATIIVWDPCSACALIAGTALETFMGVARVSRPGVPEDSRVTDAANRSLTPRVLNWGLVVNESARVR